MGPRNRTQIIKVGTRHLYQPSPGMSLALTELILSYSTVQEESFFKKQFTVEEDCQPSFSIKVLFPFLEKIYLFNVYLTKITLRKIQVFLPNFLKRWDRYF